MRGGASGEGFGAEVLEIFFIASLTFELAIISFAVKLKPVDKILDQSPASPPQEFRYRRVVGTILAIVLLAGAVTGAAIGLSSRTGNNSEEAVVSLETASEAAPDFPPAADSASGEPAGTQAGALSAGELFPYLGETAEIVGRASTQEQTLSLVQNTLDDGNSSSNSEGATATDAAERRTVSASVNEAVAKLIPSSVAIYVRADETSEEDGFDRAGSGIVIDDSGLLISAAHVFVDEEGNHITADRILIELDNGYFVDGRLLGYDIGADVAVLRFDPSNLDFKAADLADLSDLRVGDQVVAIGAPFGYVNSVNVGYVSGINRTGFLVLDEDLPAGVPTIQTDAPINSGNSGGMLANLDGEVLGVNVFIRTTSAATGTPGGNVGLGFAVPIDIAMRVAEKVLAGEQFFYGSLGVTGRLILEAGPPGPTVISVLPGQSADLAGIEPGDKIIEFEGKKVRTMNDLASFVQFHPPGEYASIVLYRNNQEVRVTATIGTSAKESLTTIVN